ncbi:hypothetical protein [Mycolicibacterium porcinum]|uniref:hypothetical protein n=1 Tax=Mycolicibacterium porcinum TaxID=39693 RepID=UPI00043661A2|nr:hypothetical protein [Mycolicibacterium porcinum]CDO29424.1 hypothetical protein BN979_02219 [Mycolicibacterium vulneris]
MLDTSYRNARIRVSAIAAGLDESQLLELVPATPEGSVHNLLAHLVGGAADSSCGHGRDRRAAMDSTPRCRAPTRSVESLLAEWERVSPVVEAGLAGKQFTGPSVAADLICHEADLNEALGLPRVDRVHWHEPFLNVMMWLLVQRLQPFTSVLIHDEHGNEWHCGSAEPTLTLRADGYELLRAMFSRRSRRQIATWNWTPAPGQQVIDCFGFFGPRDDDQPAPGKT